MIILFIFILPITYIIIKLSLFCIVKKYGKFSYDGFSNAGFAYDSKKDIFYSTKDAWQKKFGYCHLYDVGAPLFRMIIDTEPVKFYYNNKNWLLTFWKGQYGIVTGAEIGIYSTNSKHVNKRTMYFPNDEDMLNMSFTLYKKNEIIMDVNAKHWWLAAFKIGMFSKPKELSMDIKINFKDIDMLNAFLASFKKIGYKSNDYQISGSTFYFSYKKPRTKKVWTRSIVLDGIRQHFNKKNVKLYNKYLSDAIDENGIDDSKIKNAKVIMINKMIPNILRNTQEEDIFVYNYNTKKTIYLNNEVYSNLKKDYYE